MEERRATGKGQYWEVRPGVYRYRFSIGKDENGKYIRSPKRTLHCKSKTKRGREGELREAMEEYRRELNSGAPIVRKSTKTVGQYADLFHELRKGTMGSELSYKREESEIAHIKVLLGNKRLGSLKPLDIKKAYAQAREEGLYSESELHKIHTKLSQIMKEAVQDELITRNPCENISVPRPKPKERRSLSAGEASRLHRELSEEPLSAHVVGTLLLLDTGMRRGEMLGLCWECVDLETGEIQIVQQYAKDKVPRAPKSRSSRRRLHLSDAMTETLSEWKGVQTNYFAEKLGMRPVSGIPVVTNSTGGYMDPDNYNRWFREWCVKHEFGRYTEEPEVYQDAAGKRRVRKRGYEGLMPHMLRHTQATLLIGANTDIKTVQSRLGHSSAELTLNIYSHAIEAKDKAAADAFAALIE